MKDAGLEFDDLEIVAWDCGRTSIVEMDMEFASHRLWRDDVSEMKTFGILHLLCCINTTVMTQPDSLNVLTMQLLKDIHHMSSDAACNHEVKISDQNKPYI